MAGLWDRIWRRWWWRALGGLILGPFVILAVGAVSILAQTLITRYPINLAFPPEVLQPGYVMAYALMAWLFGLPLWVVMEVANVRRRRVLPIGLTLLWLFVFTAMFCMAIVGSTASARWLNSYGPGAMTGIIIVVAAYAGAVALSSLAVSPLVRRWRVAVGQSEQASEIF